MEATTLTSGIWSNLVMRPLPRVEPGIEIRPARGAGRSAAKRAAGGPETICRRSSRRIVRHLEDAPQPIVESLWSDPDRVIGSGQMLKDGDRCTVVRLDPSQTGAKP